MSDQNLGDKIGVKEKYVFRITEKDHDVVTTVTVSELDVEPKTEYVAELSIHRGANGTERVAVMPVKTDARGQTISLPTGEIDTVDEIQPGRTANITLYEPQEDPTAEFADSARVIDRASARSDNTSQDGCGSRLTSKSAAEWLGEQTRELKFRNTRTMKESVAPSHSNYETGRNYIKFPHGARTAIDARAGDLIEIIAPDTTDGMVAETTEEQIAELYDMVSEMYAAFTEASE